MCKAGAFVELKLSDFKEREKGVFSLCYDADVTLQMFLLQPLTITKIHKNTGFRAHFLLLQAAVWFSTALSSLHILHTVNKNLTVLIYLTVHYVLNRHVHMSKRISQLLL